MTASWKPARCLTRWNILLRYLASTSPDTRAKVVERFCKGGMMDWLEQRLKEVDSNVEPEAA